MPIQNFHEDFLWHKIEACNVQQWGLYIMRFNVDCHKREFIPYSSVSWEQQLSIDSETGLLTISWDGWNSVDLSCLCELCGIEPPVIPSNELVININDPEVVGKQYQSFANAFAYLNSIAGTPDEPSEFNRWAIRFNGIFNDTIDVPEFVHLVWDGRNTSWIMWGVNFLWDWGSVVSSISAYNCLLNIDQKDNWGLGWGWGSPVMININEIQAYKPANFNFAFSQLPTSWSYGLVFFGTTINLPFNSTAIDIENIIRSILPKYANITVSWNYTTGFSIRLDWLPYDTNSWISIIDISLDVFKIKRWWGLGKPQIQQFAFSAIPTDWSFKVTYSYGWNNYEQIVLASDLMDNNTMTALFDWLSNTVQIDFPDYHISPRLYAYQTPATFNVEFKWFGWSSDLIGITDNILTSTSGTVPVTANVGFTQAYSPDAFVLLFVAVPTSWTYQVHLDWLLSAPLNFNATNTDVQNAIRNMDARFSDVVVSWDYTTEFAIVLNKLPVGWHTLDFFNIDLNPRWWTKVGFSNWKIDIQWVYLNNPPTSWSFKLRFKRSDLWYTRDSNQIDWSIDAASFSNQMLLFAQAIQADIGWDIWNWSWNRVNATTFQIYFMWYGGPTEKLEVVDNTLTYPAPLPVGQWADISLYNCVVFDAKTETASTLRMFDTDIYKWDFSGFDTIIMKWGKAWSSTWEIYFSPINNVLLSEVDLQSQNRKLYINNAELINCRLSWEFEIYWNNSIKQCILDIKQILLTNWDRLSLIQTDWNGAEFVVYAWAKLRIYGTSQIVVTKQWWEVRTYGDYYDGAISWLYSKNEKGAIDELAANTSNLSWSGDPTGVVTPDRDMQLYKNTDDNTIYMSVGLTSADRVQLSTFTS